MKKLVLAIATIAILIPMLSWAQDIPCPTDQMIQQARAKNQAKGKPKSEEFYQQLRQNYDQQCALAKQELVALQSKLKEHSDGKRNDRDGYIILRKLAWQYQVLRAENHSDAQAISARMKALEKKNPKFREMQEDKLSDEVQAAAQGKQALDVERREASAWKPADKTPRAKFPGNGFSISAYQYKVEFFINGQAGPRKTITFRYPVNISPNPVLWGKDSSENILVCTNRGQHYSANDDHEKRMILLKGGRHGSLKLENQGAQHGDYCGVLNKSGDEVYQFPAESWPSHVYYPIGITNDGKRAAVMVGKAGTTTSPNEDAETNEAVSYSEVWIWDAPQSLRKVKVTQKDLNDNLLQRLREGKF